ncbi:MAG TPA: hypothetical protein VLB81_02805, partial [Gaiellales bacterium]|nr:hypothetical protein [Gaiellales bacterium]
YGNTLPSGHTTAAATLALCLIAVAPAPLRPVAAVIGAVFALGVGAAVAGLVVLLGWSRPRLAPH